VVRVEELLDSFGATWRAQQLFCLAKVCEEINHIFARFYSSSLLEEHAGRLLVHDDVDTFKSRERSLLCPLISDA